MNTRSWWYVALCPVASSLALYGQVEVLTAIVCIVSVEMIYGFLMR